MKKIIGKYITFCIALFAFAHASFAHAEENSTLNINTINEDSVYKYTFTDFNKASLLMKELREAEKLPAYTLDITEGDLYYNTGHPYMALKFYNRALYSDSARLSIHNEMKVLHRLISCYDYLKLDAQKKECVEKLLKKAKESNNTAMYSTALFELGKMIYYQGEKERAYTYFNDALKIIKDSDYELKYDNLCYYYNTIILYLLWDERLEDALVALDKLEEIITSDNDSDNVTPISGLKEKELKNLYANRAVTLARLGRTAEADEYYDKFLSFGNDKDNYLIVPYLLKRGRYKEAVRLNEQREKEFIAKGDTVNYYMASILHSLGKAYFIQGQYKNAAMKFAELASLRDSLKEREQKSAAIELAAIYDLNDKDLKIAKAQAKLHVHNMLLWTISTIAFILMIVMFLIYRNRHIIKEKNRILTSTIEELIESKKSLRDEKASNYIPKTQDPTETKPTANEDFVRIEMLLHDEELLLNPDLLRDDIIRMAHIPKNKFSQLFKDHAGMSFSEYINDKRMEHAVSMLKNNPNYTIEAIAKSVGMSNAQFYKSFKKKFGLTPSAFHKNLSNK